MGNDASRPVDPPPGTPASLPGGTSAPMGSIRRMDKVIRKKVRGEITYNMKLLVRGERGTGKTSLLARLQGLPIPETHVLTREIQTAAINWSMKGSSEESVKCEVWDVVDVGLTSKDDTDAADAAMLDPDTQGRHQVAPVDAQNVDVYQNAHGVIFLMDISKYSTLEYVKHQLDLVPIHIPTLIIGTFRDLRRGDETLKRAIFKEDVQALLYGNAKDMKNPSFRRPIEQHYFEASLSNCYGLKALHTYLGIPFLHLKVATVKQQLRLLETDLANVKLDVDATISTQKYSHFVHTIAAGADIRTGRRNPSATSTPASRPASASSTAPSLSRNGSIQPSDEDLDEDATSSDLNPATPRPHNPRPPSPPTPTPLHEPTRPRMPDMEEDDEQAIPDTPREEPPAPAVVVDDDDDLPERGDVAAVDVEPEAPSPLRTEHIQVKVSAVASGRSKKDKAPIGPPSEPAKTTTAVAGRAAATAGTKRRSFDKNETLEDFTVSTDMDRFYSDEDSNDDDDEDVVVRTLGQQPRVYRKQDFLYSDSSDSDEDVKKDTNGGTVVPPDVKAYVAVSPRAAPAPAKAKTTIDPVAREQSKGSQPSNQDESLDRKGTSKQLAAASPRHVHSEDVSKHDEDDHAVERDSKQSSDSEEQPAPQSPQRQRSRPAVVVDSDSDGEDVAPPPSARTADSSDSDGLSKRTIHANAPAGAARRPVAARPGFADSDDSEDEIVGGGKPAALPAQRPPATKDENNSDDDALDSFVPTTTQLDSDSDPQQPSPRSPQSPPAAPVAAPRMELNAVASPRHQTVAEAPSSDDDDDVFLDVIVDESDEDSTPLTAAPIARPAPALQESSDSDSRPEVVAPTAPVVRTPLPATTPATLPSIPAVESTVPAMPSLTVVNVVSSAPVEIPSSLDAPRAAVKTAQRIKQRAAKTRMDMLDSGSDLSSSPVARKGAKTAPPPATTSGERLSGDHEFVVAKSSSFWSDDEDEDEDKPVTIVPSKGSRGVPPPARPVKQPVAAPLPRPAAPAAPQMNASVLAAIEEAKRAALEMLQSTATPAFAAPALSGTSDDVKKPKSRSDKATSRKKATSKRTTSKSSARMLVVASDEDD